MKKILFILLISVFLFMNCKQATEEKDNNAIESTFFYTNNSTDTELALRPGKHYRGSGKTGIAGSWYPTPDCKNLGMVYIFTKIDNELNSGEYYRIMYVEGDNIYSMHRYSTLKITSAGSYKYTDNNGSTWSESYLVSDSYLVFK